MDSDRMTADFLYSLNSLIGNNCWATNAGQGTGSRVNMFFGKKMPRTFPINNLHISSEARAFDGEFSLFILEAAWRIESANEVICTCMDSNLEGGAILTGLGNLLGESVQNTVCCFPGFDLNIEFSNGLTLKIFSCCGGDEEDGDNYRIETPSGKFFVSGRSQLGCW